MNPSSRVPRRARLPIASALPGLLRHSQTAFMLLVVITGAALWVH